MKKKLLNGTSIFILLFIFCIIEPMNNKASSKNNTTSDEYNFFYEICDENGNTKLLTITAERIYNPLDKISPYVSQRNVSYIYTAQLPDDSADYIGKFVHEVTFVYGIPEDIAQITKGVVTITSQNSESLYRLSVHGSNKTNGNPAIFTSRIGVYVKSSGALDGTIYTNTFCTPYGTSY